MLHAPPAEQNGEDLRADGKTHAPDVAFPEPEVEQHHAQSRDRVTEGLKRAPRHRWLHLTGQRSQEEHASPQHESRGEKLHDATGQECFLLLVAELPVKENRRRVGE